MSTWQATSGLLPTQLDPAWTLTDTASPEAPVLSGGVLTLSTSAPAENMNYIQSGAQLNFSGAFYIEATLRLVSGASTSTNRAPIAIGFTSAPSTGKILYIGTDEIFFTAPGDVKGVSAMVDTDGAFHTYRIDVTATGAIKVFQDSVLVLSSSTHVDTGNFGISPRVFWGEASLLANGTSQWTRVQHNVLATPEPSSLLLLTLGGCGVYGARRMRRRTQRPA